MPAGEMGTLTSIITTTSTEIPIGTFPTEATIGSIIRRIAETLRMETGRRRISTAARLEAKAEGGPVLVLEHVPVQEELELGPVEAELALDPVEAERELAQAAVELELNRVERPEPVQVAVELARGQVEAVPERDPVAVPLRTKSVTAAHHRGLVPAPRVEDSAAAAETTREPAAAEAAVAWEAAE